MNKKKLYESIMRQVSKEVKKALNENLNHCTDVDYDLYNNALDARRSIPQPKIDFSGITDIDDANELVDNAKYEYEKKIAKSLGYKTPEALFNAITKQDPDEAEWMIFQSFTDQYVNALTNIEKGRPAEENEEKFNINMNRMHIGADETYLAYEIKSTEENKQATLLYNRYIKEMKEIDKQVADVIKQFGNNPMYKRTFSGKISMLTYSLQANHADDELNLTDTTTFDDPNIMAAYQYRCTNKQLVNYGFVNDIPAWFDITWNFSEFSECTMPDFCYAVLTTISKKPGMKMELNGKNDINFIFANEMSVQNAYVHLMKQYKMFANSLMDALEEVAEDYVI